MYKTLRGRAGGKQPKPPVRIVWVKGKGFPDKGKDKEMTIRQAIKGLAGVFKPGYPTGRNEYIVLDSGRDEALREFSRRGICAVRCCCGYDYNYRGWLYRLETANKERNK